MELLDFVLPASEPEEDEDIVVSHHDGESESGIESTRHRRRRTRYILLGILLIPFSLLICATVLDAGLRLALARSCPFI